jgi:hypothetical protein
MIPQNGAGLPINGIPGFPVPFVSVLLFFRHNG